MSKTLNEKSKVKNEVGGNDNTVMSKVACHYVSLPKIIALKLEDPVFHSSLSLKDRRVLSRFLSKNSSLIKKVSPKSKNIPSKKFANLVDKRKTDLKTKRAATTLLKDDGKKLITEILNKSRHRKLTSKSPISNTLNTKKESQARKKISVNNNSGIKSTKKPVSKTIKTKSEIEQVKLVSKRIIEESQHKMNISNEDDILKELEHSDSEILDEDSPEIYNELIESLGSVSGQMISDPGVKKQALSKNIVKVNVLAQKATGTKMKSGIVRKNTLPVQATSKAILKPNKTLVQSKQIKNIMSSPDKQRIIASSLQNINKKQLVKSPNQKAIKIQSVEAINSKAKSPESTVQMPKTIKQTATVSPLTKARKSFTTGPSKLNVVNKNTKMKEEVKSEPMNLLSELVGLPISPAKMEVVPLESANSSAKPSSVIKNQNPNNNTADLLKILSDEGINTSQSNEPNTNNAATTSEDEKEKSETEDIKANGVAEAKPRTIYDLMAEINLVYPSWNIHIMPDTNSFCIAQIHRGRLGMPVLKKCIELDEDYNAKVFVHQYHCKRFDGQYDSEESIIALIHEINAIKA